MADMKDLVKIAVDARRGNVEKYSVGQSMELLQKALVELNGGSTVIDYRRIRDGKCNGVFALVEEILSRTVVDGLMANDFFMSLVDFRNVAEGDKNLFEVEDRNLFVVSELADGTQGVRRQRLGGMTETSIPTSLHAVKIYEELNRVLSGRSDFNKMINAVSESFQRQILQDVYTLWCGATAQDFGGTAFFPAAGSYDEDELLEVISHVEAAANGAPATIIGTKKAIRHIDIAPFGDNGKNDLYNLGYAGKFYGTKVVAAPQRHVVGGTAFVMDDNILTVVAGDAKPIKFVYEGNPLVIMGDPMTKGDMTQEYLYAEKYGLGIVLAGGNAGIGRYEIA